MTLIITPAVSAAPEAPSFAPANDARSQPHRAATFGPALSDARDRLAAPDARRSDSPDRRPSRAERSAPPADRPGASRPDAANQGAVVDETSENADVDLEGAEGSALESIAPEETAPEEPVTEEAAPEEAVTDDQAREDSAALRDGAPASLVSVSPAPVSHAPMAVATAVAATLLPTAKGTAGDDDPSIDVVIEEVVSPDSAREVPATELTVIDDGVTSVDIGTITSPVVSERNADAGETDRQVALTSLENVSDVNLERADRIQTATTEEVAGPAISTDDATRADPVTELQRGEAAPQAPIHGRVQEPHTGRPNGTEVSADASSDEAPADIGTVTADQPTIEAGLPDRPVQQTAINTVNRSDSPESVVVLAREAAPATDTAKPAPTSAAQTTGPMQTAEANLWEDVRSAFDRIRSTGDGQEVRIRLRPAELGELLVQIRTQGDHVAVRLVASSAAAQQTLVDDRQRLAAELARAGFEEGSVDISQQNAGESGSHRGETGDDSNADRPGGSVRTINGADGLATTREIFERREPIRTDSGFRPGRSVQSTINLTL